MTITSNTSLEITLASKAILLPTCNIMSYAAMRHGDPGALQLLLSPPKIDQKLARPLSMGQMCERLDRRLKVVFFECCKSSASIVLRSSAALLVAEVLAGVRRKETCQWVRLPSAEVVRASASHLVGKLADVLSILAASLHLGLVVRLGKRLFLACHLRHWAI